MATLVEVVSSNIKGVGWENNTLLVEYMNGNKYEFYDVPKDIYEQFMQADSKGRYFNSSIKGSYKYKKLD